MVRLGHKLEKTGEEMRIWMKIVTTNNVFRETITGVTYTNDEQSKLH